MQTFLLLLAFVTLALSARTLDGGKHLSPPAQKLRIPRQNLLQDVVTWDEYSLMINGSRTFIFSGEVHPYRMPVQSLHLDIFQKIKAAGFNAVSFYIFWGILEPKRGTISFEGFRDLQPFFDAAMEAGLYLIARPGPYINAETAAGGLPGWSFYTPGIWRTSNTTYVDAFEGYLEAVGATIAANQVTNGGPIILVQSENEYSGWAAPYSEDFEYESILIQKFRAAGITVPLTANDAWPGGHYTSVDIYGYDSYPAGFDCSSPDVTASDAVPEWFWDAHLAYTPNVPNAVFEFQGGSFDGWGGSGYELCSALIGPEFQRVFYKNELAMSTTLLNLYMLYGGTNWGGIAHPGVYSSYDYGAAISEARVLREKYYDQKLITYFLRVSPSFLTTRPQNIDNNVGSFTGNAALKTTQALDVVGKQTSFYVVKQTDASLFTAQTYQLTVSTSAGTLTLPQLGGNLTLNGKDSKIHVVDYQAGSTSLLYSTGEILTWTIVEGRTVILLYGNAGETHETAFKFNGTAPTAKAVSGNGTIRTQVVGNQTALAIQYTIAGQTVVEVGSNLLLYILDRENAYQFWVLYPPATGTFAKFCTENPILIKGGYLLRSAEISGDTLAVMGDLNATSSFEFITPSSSTKKVTLNGDSLSLKTTSYGTFVASKTPQLPSVSLPNLATNAWKFADSLPEIQSSYNDAAWALADHNATTNPTQPLTPTVLYAGDYQFHTGNLLWRAHFSATGTETGFNVTAIGGSAFGYSIWLDSTFIGSWEGDAVHSEYSGIYSFPSTLKVGSTHVITVLQDHMGYEEYWTVGQQDSKTPRGILSYSFIGSNQPAVLWKVQGNLGGEDYADTARGPLNEGGLYAERQGWHLPGFDDSKWPTNSPSDGIAQAGVGFYRTTFSLSIPSGVDYPIGIAIKNATTNTHFRSQIYVNGYQFGKYINAIGPQSLFPIPQGILNHNSANTLAVSLWAHDKEGAKLPSIELEIISQVESSMPEVTAQPQPEWTARPNAV